MIRIHQCDKDCCTVREPDKRFWFITDAEGNVLGQETSKAAALAAAIEQLNKSGAPS